MKVLGEYGLHGGSSVVTVSTVYGHSKEIRSLWSLLGRELCATEEARIIARLRRLGAVKEI